MTLIRFGNDYSPNVLSILRYEITVSHMYGCSRSIINFMS